MGKCPECGTWNSLVETVISKSNSPRFAGEAGLSNSKPIKLSEIKASQTNRVSTGISELDMVLGGGIVPGMAVLLSGEPGIGKSTLLLELADKIDIRHPGTPPAGGVIGSSKKILSLIPFTPE